MAKGTPATVVLEKAGVAFKLHEYDYDPNAARIGMQAADALGVSPSRLLKTLMAKAGWCGRLRADRQRSRGEPKETRGGCWREGRVNAAGRGGRTADRLP